MWIGVITVLPEMLDALEYGVIGRAQTEGVLTVEVFNPREFTVDKHRTIDDKPYGGGPGMVMMVEPLQKAIDAAQTAARAHARTVKVVYLSPAGALFNQAKAVSQARDEAALILVCGRFEGVDQRVIDACVDEEWSVGDYVVSGGELPAMMVIDAIGRNLPGTLGNSDSIFSESHLDGKLEYPQYTRPENHGGVNVPPELLTGDHGGVERYRNAMAYKLTYERRPEQLTGRIFGSADLEALKSVIDGPGQG